MDTVDRVELAGLALVPLAVPPLELALDVPVVPAEVVESGIDQVDGVDGRHRVDDRTAGVRSCGLVEDRLGRPSVANDVAVDEAHDVERRVVDRRVVAVSLDGRHGHRGTLQAGQDPVLATHVVGARQHVTERWTAQDERAFRRRR